MSTTSYAPKPTTQMLGSEALLDAARRLSPLIRQHAADAERERRLSPAVIDALREAGLFRLLLPRLLGGLEIDPVTCSRIVEEVASADSAAGWALQAGNAGAWWAARLPQAGADEIYGSSPSAIIDAAFHPPQTISTLKELTGRMRAFGFTRPLRERPVVQASLAKA